MLINKKVAKWQITAQCEKFRQTIACEILHSTIASAVIEVSRNENTNKDFEAISARMIGLVDEYKFKFDNLRWKDQTILGKIPDPKEQNS